MQCITGKLENETEVKEQKQEQENTDDLEKKYYKNGAACELGLHDMR